MLDPMLTLIAAKAKAVGLVAGTAMVTTALVGGGAVAMTAVNAEGDVQEETAVVQTVEAPADLAVAPTSDTGTVGIDPEVPEEPKVRPPLPDDFTCDESKNHGQNVSAYARSLPKGPGRGEKVSAVAQSDCGKAAGDAEEEVELEASEAEEAEAPKAEKKAGRPEGKGKPAGAGKPEGKGKPGGKS